MRANQEKVQEIAAIVAKRMEEGQRGTTIQEIVSVTVEILGGPTACECPARKALEVLLQTLELSDLPGYIYDADKADCVECGRTAAEIRAINHADGCLMASVEQARSALSTHCPCGHLRDVAAALATTEVKP